jgi:hypothetical protein
MDSRIPATCRNPDGVSRFPATRLLEGCRGVALVRSKEGGEDGRSFSALTMFWRPIPEALRMAGGSALRPRPETEGVTCLSET